jgi:predicted ABC-type ATPase
VSHAFDARPVIVAIAGPNGAGKSTFFEVFVKPAGLRFINADVIAKETGIGAYEAAAVAERARDELVAQGESFAFETVFSDPVGAKIAFLQDAVARGYTVVLCFIGLDSASTSDDRVAMRVLQGGHDVPADKVLARFPRSLENLKRAMQVLPFVWIYDNSDLTRPFRKVAEVEQGAVVRRWPPLPAWLDEP